MVEGGGLENRFPIRRDAGSNPASSAMYVLIITSPEIMNDN